jgi:hypothetical protein
LPKAEQLTAASKPAKHLEVPMTRPIPAWVVLILMLGALAAGAAMPEPPAFAQAPESRVLSGSDLGFRVERLDRAGNPQGTLVVRVNGAWIAATSSLSLRPLSQ